MLDRNQLKAEKIEYDQRHTVIKMKYIDHKSIRLLCSQDSYLAAEEYLTKHKAVMSLLKTSGTSSRGSGGWILQGSDP